MKEGSLFLKMTPERQSIIDGSGRWKTLTNTCQNTWKLLAHTVAVQKLRMSMEVQLELILKTDSAHMISMETHDPVSWWRGT